MKLLVLIIGLSFALTGCREAPSKEECAAGARKRSTFFFAGKSGKNAARGRKMEFEASMEECMATWSKEEAICIGKATNRNQLISCR